MTGSQRARWLATLREYVVDGRGWTAEQVDDISDLELLDKWVPYELVWQVWWEIKRTSLEWNTVTL